MGVDTIGQVEIEGAGRLLVTPDSARFPYIYREAMEVHWDDAGGFLFAPKPREWSYLDWFRQIVEAAQTQGGELQLSERTRWINVPADVVTEIRAYGAKA